MSSEHEMPAPDAQKRAFRTITDRKEAPGTALGSLGHHFLTKSCLINCESLSGFRLRDGGSRFQSFLLFGADFSSKELAYFGFRQHIAEFYVLRNFVFDQAPAAPFYEVIAGDAFYVFL